MIQLEFQTAGVSLRRIMTLYLQIWADPSRGVSSKQKQRLPGEQPLLCIARCVDDACFDPDACRLVQIHAHPPVIVVCDNQTSVYCNYKNVKQKKTSKICFFISKYWSLQIYQSINSKRTTVAIKTLHYKCF